MIYEVFKMEEKGSLDYAKLTVYVHDASDAFKIEDRPFVVLCPGGGYAYTSDREAEPLAFSFLAKGCNVAILRYSCAPATYPTALLELGRSILIIKENARKWNIKKNSLVVQGCSAGGHLAASYACMWKQDFLSEQLGISKGDVELLRPNGLLLCYPVITSGVHAHRGSFENLCGDKYDELVDKMSLENCVNEDVPRTFIWHTFTDGSVPVENSLLFATALREKNINTELHIFPQGCHGLGLANELTLSKAEKELEPVCQPWIDLAGNWMKFYF